MKAISLALMLGVFALYATPARAQPVGILDFSFVDTMDFQTLIDAIQDVADASDDSGALTQIQGIARDITQIDRDDPPNIVEVCVVNPVPPPACNDEPVFVNGGRHMLNLIINALAPGTAPTDWYGPGMDVDNLPTDVGPAVDILTAAMNGDSAALSQVHAAFVDNDFFSDVGLVPTYDHDNDDLTAEIYTGQNVGVDALAYMIAGTGFTALETLAIALETGSPGTGAPGDPDYVAPSAETINARHVLTIIFSYGNTSDPMPAPPDAPFIACMPSTEPCLMDKSADVLNILATGLRLLGSTTGFSPAEIIRQAIAGDQTAQFFVNSIITSYLEDDPCAMLDPPDPSCEGAAGDPDAPGYIGPAAVDFLETAITGLTGTLPEQPPLEDPEEDIAEKPEISSMDPGAPDPELILVNDPFCEYTGDNVPLSGDGSVGQDDGQNAHPLTAVGLNPGSGGGDFGTNPCHWTKDARSLEYAQWRLAGARWAAYIEAWTAEQWLPALRRMTAELSAAIINQTRMIGSAFDAIAASHTALRIQENEYDAKKDAMPSELACASASGLATGMAYSGNVSTSLRQVFKRDLMMRSNSILPTPLPEVP